MLYSHLACHIHQICSPVCNKGSGYYLIYIILGIKIKKKNTKQEIG